jgi:hypothetical protein
MKFAACIAAVILAYFGGVAEGHKTGTAAFKDSYNLALSYGYICGANLDRGCLENFRPQNFLGAK